MAFEFDKYVLAFTTMDLLLAVSTDIGFHILKCSQTSFSLFVPDLCSTAVVRFCPVLEQIVGTKTKTSGLVPKF